MLQEVARKPRQLGLLRKHHTYTIQTSRGIWYRALVVNRDARRIQVTIAKGKRDCLSAVIAINEIVTAQEII